MFRFRQHLINKYASGAILFAATLQECAQFIVKQYIIQQGRTELRCSRSVIEDIKGLDERQNELDDKFDLLETEKKTITYVTNEYAYKSG